MIIRNDNDLIGDFLGTIPAMIELSKIQPLEVIIPDKIAGVFDLISKRYNITRATSNTADLSFNLHGAYALAESEGLHMIQANFPYMNLPIPRDVPRPELEFDLVDAPRFDYVLAPFSRSLPPEQKWQQEKWQELVNRMPDKLFCLLGDDKLDDPYFITGNNVTSIFGQPMANVCNLLRRSAFGLISVVTGISHLAYALDVRNYLFVNQGPWGKNPDAIYFDRHIPEITVDEVFNKIKI